MLMKLKHNRALNEEILKRFLIDTFDEITTQAPVEKILEDVNKENSQLRLFDDKDLTLRFINSSKRNVLNCFMGVESIKDDSIQLNDEVYFSKIKSMASRDTYCDLSYVPLREGGQVVMFDTGRKYIADNLTETEKHQFVDERTMKKNTNNIGRKSVN